LNILGAITQQLALSTEYKPIKNYVNEPPPAIILTI